MFELIDHDQPSFEVLTYHFVDVLGEPFQLSLAVQSSQHDIDMDDVVGRRGRMTWGRGLPLERVEGIVRECRVISSEEAGRSRYRLIVVPPLWLLSRRVSSRIFQNRTVPQIVADVIADHSPVAAPQSRLARTYPAREYCAQFAETDLDFVQRIMSEEGITAYFDDQGNWVLCDMTDTLTPERAEAFPFVPRGMERAQASGPTVHDVGVVAKLKTSIATYRDYDFQNPAALIEGRHETPANDRFEREEGLEQYEFEVGRAGTTPDATGRAERMLDATRVPGRRLDLEADFVLHAGRRITVSGHSRSETAHPLLVYRVMVHGGGEAGGGGTDARLECIDARLRYRPRRIKRPHVMGAQTAEVVGASSGDEIDVDSHARVLLRFPWDRRGLEHNTSRRVRVSQGWAGPDYGFVCLPRVGDEVVVDFLLGDPDQPIVVGRVHNGRNAVPLSLPRDKMISIWKSKSTPGGGGYNQILLDDTAGAERVDVRAQHDWHRHVRHNSDTEIGNRRTIRVGGNTDSRIDGHHKEHVDKDMALDVAGDRVTTVEQNDTLEVRKDSKLTVAENRTVQVTKDQHHTIDGDRTAKVQGEDTIVVTKSRAVSVDGRLVTDVNGQITFLSGEMVKIECGDSVITADKDGLVVVTAKEIMMDGAERVSISGSSVLIEGSSQVNVNGGAVAVRGSTVTIN